MEKQKIKRLLVIDGNALAHRAYHALPQLSTKQGELVNAVYGFLLLFLKALRELKPEYVAATFDLAGPTFRHEQFKEYKATRVKAPDDFYQQLPKIKEVLTAFKIPIYEKQGFEADDLIGAISCLASKKQATPEIETIILSGDMDNLQLVNNKVKVYTMRKGIKDTVLYDIEKVKEKYSGLVPAQLQDYRGLRGDPSDNIPGVSGIGEKTAIELLKKFGTLENLYQEIEKNSKTALDIKPGVLQKLKNSKDQAFLSKKLSQIDCSSLVDFDLKDCEFKTSDFSKAKQVLEKFEFYSLVNKFLEIMDPGSFPIEVKKEKIGIQKKLKPMEKSPNPAQGFLFSGKSSPIESIIQEIEKFEQAGIFSQQIAEIEKSLVPVVSQMGKNGIKVDLSKLKALSVYLEKEISLLTKKIYKLSGQEFNINSSQQLSEILFDKIGISYLGMKKTPGGVISTGADELAKIQASHPVIKLILQYREMFKLKSGFVDSLSGMVDPKDGRIHPLFHQLGTETGRMSCSAPNLQNIPIKGDLGLTIRKCFIAQAGWELLSADYSQMELRIVAFLSGDKKMLGVFKQDKDIHILTASEIFELPEEKITKEMRDLAKTLNFGILYGMGPVAFSGRIGISRQKAKDFIKKYFQEFEEIAIYIEKSKQEARDKGFSETMFGRKRFLLGIDSFDPRIKAQAERMAINMPVQGAAADIIKIAMAELARKKILNSDCKLLLQVHDELVFEIKQEKIKGKSATIQKIMEEATNIGIPLKVKIGHGKNWGEL